jgi:flavin reductase (DIM6/NTAB) family NADH-FMN oxidoreductase RutF
MSLADQFKRGMRRLAGGVCLITTQDETGPAGLVATSVVSLCVAPRPSWCASERTRRVTIDLSAPGYFA